MNFRIKINSPVFLAGICILLLLSISGYSQKVKHITTRFPHSKIVREDYYVLKSNKRTKHGEYTLYSKFATGCNGAPIEYKIKQHGFYVDGKKDGFWTETGIYGREERGIYTNGVRAGIWETYDKYGIKMGSYDYTLGRKIGTWIYSDGKQTIEQNYETGEIKTKPILRNTLRYPEEARREGIQGRVLLQFHLNTNCTMDDIKVIQSVSPECDAEALKQLKFLEKVFLEQENCTDSVRTMYVDFKLVD